MRDSWHLSAVRVPLGMAHRTRVLIATIATAFCLAVGPRCQAPAAALRFEAANPELTAWLARCARSLREEPGADREPGVRVAHRMLGQLRLGDFGRARASLVDAWAAAAGPAQAAAPAADLSWLVVAHYWYLRATHDAATVRAHLEVLCAAALAGTSEPVAHGTYVDEALRVHGLFCIGGMLDTMGRLAKPAPWPPASPADRPGARWTRRAIERLLELEREAWLPDAGHCSPAGGDPTADASLLAPAAAGLLVATGDRAMQNLRAALHELDATRVRPDCNAAPFAPCCTALRLAAAAQLDDDGARTRCWLELLREHAGAGSGEDAPDVAGAHLDAACFAVAGLRLATGAGVDEACVRLRPWLPPGHDHLVVRGLHADGACFDLELTARAGPPCDDEAGEAAMQHVRGGRRLRVRLTLSADTTETPRTVALQGVGAQYLTLLRAGDVLERSLPRQPAERDDDAGPPPGIRPHAERVR